MKLKTSLLAIALLTSSTLTFAGNCIDELTQTVSKFPNVEKVNLNPFLLSMLKPFASEMKGFKSVSVIDADLTSKNYDKVKKILDQCDSTEYETVISENNGNEMNCVWIKTQEEYISEIVVIALETDEVSIVRIKGKIDPAHLQNIIAENN